MFQFLPTNGLIEKIFCDLTECGTLIQAFTRGKLDLSKEDGEIMSLLINNQFQCPNSKQVVDLIRNVVMPLVELQLYMYIWYYVILNYNNLFIIFYLWKFICLFNYFT